MKVLVVTGLLREAALAAGSGVETLAGGGSRPILEDRLAALATTEFSAVVSFGFAGALAADLAVGSLVIGTGVTDATALRPAHAGIMGQWTRRLAAANEPYREVVVAGVDAPLLTPGDKALTRRLTGGETVDMESHIAAAFAQRLGVPFGILRVISDSADRTLPPVAATSMGRNGRIDVRALLGGLVRNPGQIPTLLRTGRDAAEAFRTLRRVSRLLGPRLGLHL